MKFTLAFLSALFAVSSARKVTDIKADSGFGKKLISKARKVEEGNVDMSWVPDMSVKFVGCHHISQWNPDADGEDDVRIETKRLAIFRLCPTSSCNSNSAKGCTAGYGDYIVDMDEFLASYLENKEETEAYNCEYQAENNCDCDGGDDDQFDAEACEQQCYEDAGMDYCVEKKYYDENGDEYEKFDAMEYTECAQYEGKEERRRRRLEDADGDDDGAEAEYYIGAYCGNDGATLNLGMFTDDACTEFVEDNTYGKSTFYEMEGEELPYASSSIVENGCISCEDPEADQYYPEPNEFCEGSYVAAGKCESNLNNENVEANENACGFISAVKTTGASGIINSGNTGGNSVASAFIFIFSASFVMLGSYVYYLKTKLDRGRINLSD